jgi:Ca-activated chloride channel family protein
MRRIALIALLAGTVLTAQETTPRFTGGVQLIEVYATVIDAGGEPVADLTRDDFLVREDGIDQDISAFAAGSFPLAIALGIDRSWSMAGQPLQLAKQASQAFLSGLRPTDRSMVVAIGAEAEVIAPMSDDRPPQLRAIDALDPWSTTSLHDAIIVALDRLDAEPGRQALIVFSDGADRYSGAGASEVLARARRSRALVYPIALGTTRPPLLAELAVISGGTSFRLGNAAELERTLAAIARELRSQYLIGYVPSRPADAGARQWRSITVSVKNRPPGTRVRARDGYMTE